MTLLAALGKTGRIGAEDLKQYMDFLVGGPASKQQGTSGQMYLWQSMPQEKREAMAKNWETSYTTQTQNAPKEFEGLGLSEKEITAGLGGKQTLEQLQNFSLKLQDKMQAAGWDEPTRQRKRDYLEKAIQTRMQAEAMRTFASGNERGEGKGDVVRLGLAQQAGGATQLGAVMQTGNMLNILTKGNAGNMRELATNPMAYAGAHKTAMGELKTVGGYSEEEAQKFFASVRPTNEIAAKDWMEEAAGKKESADKLLEILQSTGYKTGEVSDAQEFFQKNKNNSDVWQKLSQQQEMFSRWPKLIAEGRMPATEDEKTRQKKDAQELAMRTQSVEGGVKNALMTYFTEIINIISWMKDNWPFW